MTETAIVQARTAIANGSKSFAMASRMMPRASRDQVALVYAWCRRADDAIDEVPASAQPAALATLEHELDEVYRGTPADPILAGFGQVVRIRSIPRAYPAALLAGMGMDVTGTRYQTLDELKAYCWRVAAVVGLMMSHVLGVRRDEALVEAAHLGIAMQLTNVCRDVAEDWQRGRLYIPDELLAKHGAPGLADRLGGPLPADAVAPLARAVEELLAIADTHYRRADRGIAALPWRGALAVRAARRIYAAIGGRIAAQRYDVTAGRAVVSTPRKLGHLGVALAYGLAEVPGRVVSWARGRRPRVPGRILELADV